MASRNRSCVKTPKHANVKNCVDFDKTHIETRKLDVNNDDLEKTTAATLDTVEKLRVTRKNKAQRANDAY